MTPRPRILLTGFEPFAGASVNPSWEAVRALRDTPPAGIELHVRCLPCAYGGTDAALAGALDETAPDWTLLVGQAGGRASISLERFALNLDDTATADNAGIVHVDHTIVEGGPLAYASTLPLKAMAAALRADGLPAELSSTAGHFLCNRAFYLLMHTLRDTPHRRGGFVHVPHLPQQTTTDRPSLALAEQVRALRLLVECCRDGVAQTGTIAEGATC